MIESNVTEKVKETIRKHSLLEGVRHVVLGFSGGPDSICLFDVLWSLREEYSISIHPVHVNHGIRKDVCHEEQEFCRDFAKGKGLELTVYEYDCPALAKEWGMSTEEAGRKLRYQAFLNRAVDVAKNYEGEVAIAVAQNRDDQVETVLMRILRGTGINGLKGIPYKRRDQGGFDVIRPLLDVSKSEVLDYCKENNLRPRIDLTNFEPIYQRNKIRLELIPYLKENYNGNIEDSIIRLAESAAEDRSLIEELSSLYYGEGVAKEEREEAILLDNRELLKLPPAIRKGIILKALKNLGLKEDMTYRHFEALESLVFSDNPSAHQDLPAGFFGERRYEDLLLGRSLEKAEAESEDITHEIIGHEVVGMDEFQNRVAKGLLPKGEYAAFDYHKMRKSYGENVLELLAFREKGPGDTIKLGFGTKKIQDLLVDAKVPAMERKEIRVLAIGNNVLWVILPNKMYRRWTVDFSMDNSTEKVLIFQI